MPRSKRETQARDPSEFVQLGEVFHVLNRAVTRLTTLEKPDDWDAFLRVLDEIWQIVPLPIFAMVVMPNYWHFVVRPDEDGQVTGVLPSNSL